MHLHLFEGHVDFSAFRGSELRRFAVEVVGRVAPGFRLRRGNIAERGLLLLDLLAHGLEVRFDLAFEPAPLRFQLRLRALPSGFARLSLFLDHGLKLGAPLRGLDNFDSYECRGRNRVRGATLSEHGRANALDVRAFKLANGEMIGLTDVNVAKAWRDGLRAGACARFSTVLGPGSDGHHEEHIHVDLAERRGGYKMCEWDVRNRLRLRRKRSRRQK